MNLQPLETEHGTFLLYNMPTELKHLRFEADALAYWMSRSDLITLDGENPRNEKLSVGRYVNEVKKTQVRRLFFGEAARLEKTLVNPSVNAEYATIRGKHSDYATRAIDRGVLLMETGRDPDHDVLSDFEEIVLSSKIYLLSKDWMERLKIKPRILIPTGQDKRFDYLHDIKKIKLALLLIRECMKRYPASRKFVEAHGLDSVFYYNYDSPHKKWEVREEQYDPFAILTKT